MLIINGTQWNFHDKNKNPNDFLSHFPEKCVI